MKTKNLIFVVVILAVGACFAESLEILHPKRATPIAKVQKRNKKAVINDNEAALLKLKEATEKGNQLLGKFQNKGGIWDFTSEFDFKTGTVIKGILLNSVVSTNLESPLLVKVDGGEVLPENTIFSCKGVTKYKRVMAACDRLILDNKVEEYEVQVGLLNIDGSVGLKADEVYTGKEEFVASSLALAFSKGLIELNTDRLASPLGEITANTRKNRITSGLLSSLDESSNIVKDEMQNREPKVYIKAGRKVLIYFFERFKR